MSWSSFRYCGEVPGGERFVEVERLRVLGEDVVPVLCGLLRDPDPRKRVLAARGLAEDGDYRALEPLLEELSCYARITAPQRGATIGAVILVGCSVGSVLVDCFAARYWSGAEFRQIVGDHWAEATSEVRGHHRYVRALLDAIAAIAAKETTPQLRSALPALNRIAADLSLLAEARQLAARTARQIQSETAQTSALPGVSVPVDETLEQLPLISPSK